MSRAKAHDAGGLTMGDGEILEDTTRSTGREALKKNAGRYCSCRCDSFNSWTQGIDKLLIDDDGRTLVTNDGVTVLETAVEHPVAKMIIVLPLYKIKLLKTELLVLLFGF